MLLIELAYFSFSGVLFFIASYPFIDEMRNGESFYSNLRVFLKNKRRGSRFLLFAFLNVLLASSFFFLTANIN
jgi:hypothetical protein